MLKITPPSEPIATTTLVVTLFGQPGAGKSTLAFSAPKPLLLDFDGGAQRAAGRKDVVRINSWADVSSIEAADVANYDTIILDTVGRALEFLAVDLMAGDPKLRKKSGDLAIAGYGALKTAFASWLSRVRGFGKHIILIAHEKEEKNGDETIVRVDAMGATRVEVIRLSDLVGFVSIDNGRRVLDFNPTDKHTGKNCAAFEPLTVGNVASSPNWLADTMTEALTRMNAQSEEQRKREAELAKWRDLISNLETAEDVTAEIANLPDDPLIKRELSKRAKALGFVWNPAAKAFVQPEREDAAA